MGVSRRGLMNHQSRSMGRAVSSGVILFPRSKFFLGSACFDPFQDVSFYRTAICSADFALANFHIHDFRQRVDHEDRGSMMSTTSV